MKRRSIILLYIVVPVLASCAVVVCWWLQNWRPTYTAIDLSWLSTVDPGDGIVKLNGRRVIVTGTIKSTGGPTYGLCIQPKESEHWTGPILLYVTPAAGEPAPAEREKVTVSGILRVTQSAASGEYYFTLTADPRGTPTTPVMQVAMVSAASWSCAVCGIAPFPAAILLGIYRDWNRSHANRRRNLPGHCPACGYDLRATPDRCPECGAVRVVKGIA